jgi:hypothetical protein
MQICNLAQRSHRRNLQPLTSDLLSITVHQYIKNPSPLQGIAHRLNRLLRASLSFCCTLLVAERRLLIGAEASRSMVAELKPK